MVSEKEVAKDGFSDDRHNKRGANSAAKLASFSIMLSLVVFMGAGLYDKGHMYERGTTEWELVMRLGVGGEMSALTCAVIALIQSRRKRLLTPLIGLVLSSGFIIVLLL